MVNSQKFYSVTISTYGFSKWNRIFLPVVSSGSILSKRWKKLPFYNMNYTFRNFYRNFPKHVTVVLFSYSFVKLRWNFKKFSYFLVNLRNNFLIFSYKVLNILILVSGNSATYKRNNLTFWVTGVLCSYM